MVWPGIRSGPGVAVPFPEGGGFVPAGAPRERVRAFLSSLRPSHAPFDWDSFWEGVEAASGGTGPGGAGPGNAGSAVAAGAPGSVAATILTDLQATTWTPPRLAADAARWEAWAGAGGWTVVPVGAETENVAVASARLPTGRPVAGVPQRLAVRLVRYGGIGSGVAEVFLEGAGGETPPRSVR